MKKLDETVTLEGVGSTVVLERKPAGLAEFIEKCGGFKLYPYQRELIAALERGEKIMRDPATMREPYSEWKQRYIEYLRTFRREV